jgi:membrane-associated phospholipid phosphatase
MLQKIIEIDQYLFLKINQDGQNSFFDTILPFARMPLFWAPFYLFLIVFVFINFGKKAWWWLCGLLLNVTLTDIISSRIIKPLVARPRPCMDEYFSIKVRVLVNHCGANGSFTSSHAANHFGVAMFLFITLQHFSPKFIYIAFVWAAIICYAQIYVGVHYPTDIMGGTFVGLFVGLFVGNFYNTKRGILSLN